MSGKQAHAVSAARERHIDRGQGVQPGGREIGQLHIIAVDQQFDLGAAGDDAFGAALAKPVRWRHDRAASQPPGPRRAV